MKKKKKTTVTFQLTLRDPNHYPRDQLFKLHNGYNCSIYEEVLKSNNGKIIKIMTYNLASIVIKQT